MKTVQKIAFWLGLAEIIAGGVMMASPFVMAKTTKNPIKRFMYKRKQRNIMNVGTGLLMGLGALSMAGMPVFQMIRSRVGSKVREGMDMANTGLSE